MVYLYMYLEEYNGLGVGVGGIGGTYIQQLGLYTPHITCKTLNGETVGVRIAYLFADTLPGVTIADL